MGNFLAIGSKGSFIGRIANFDRLNLVDLPNGLPEDMFSAPARVQLLGNRLNIGRARSVREDLREIREPRNKATPVSVLVEKPKLNKKAKKRAATAV